jgi:hypothetical protein
MRLEGYHEHSLQENFVGTVAVCRVAVKSGGADIRRIGNKEGVFCCMFSRR